MTASGARRIPLLLVALVLFSASPVGSVEQKPEIEALIAELGSADEFEREATIDAVAEMGMPTVPFLIGAFESDDVHIRRGAMYVLKRIGPASVPALLEALDHESPQVRWTAAAALKADELNDSFDYSRLIVFALIERLDDPDPRVRRRVAQSLYDFEDESASPTYHEHEAGQAKVSALVVALRDPDPAARRAAVESLSELTDARPLPSIQDLVSRLTRALDDPDGWVRGVAALTLGHIGSGAQSAIPRLTQALADPDPFVRFTTAMSLAWIGEPAHGVSPKLQPLLEDPHPGVRASAAWALATLGDHRPPVVRELRQALMLDTEDERERAAYALGAIGAPAGEAVPELIELLGDIYPEVRRAAALALGRIGEQAITAVPELTVALEDRDASVRNYAARALGRIGQRAESAIPALEQTLQDPDPSVRAHAARSLGQISLEADVAIPELSAALEDPNQLVRGFSAEALGKIAISVEGEAKDLSQRELGKRIEDLELAQTRLEAAKQWDSDNQADYVYSIATIGHTLDALRIQRYGLLYDLRPSNWVLGGVAYVILLPAFWSLLLWLSPLALFRINHALEPYEFRAPRALGENKFSIRYLVLIGFFYHHPRVLDAWVRANLATVRETFERRPTAQKHRLFTSLPLVLDRQVVPELTPSALRPAFSRQPSVLLVWGEGGSGKASLALRIARWAMSDDPDERPSKQPMLPVLIEGEINAQLPASEDPNATPITEAIRGQLQDLTGSTEPLSHGVVTALLRHRSLLVIVRRFSELSQASRDLVRPELPSFPANALIVTSRREEPLGQVTKAVLEPRPISAECFPAFLESYVAERSLQPLVDTTQQAALASHFAAAVGPHSVPLLLARLYADQAIAGIEGRGPAPADATLQGPLLAYLHDLNQEVPTPDGGDADIQQVADDAQTIAWECLKSSLHPAPARRREVLAALGGDDAAARLEHLEQRLRLVQPVRPDRLRFPFELLAEYLAATHLVESLGQDEPGWLEILHRADEMPREATRSFLVALEVCCRSGAKVPSSVVEELSRRTKA